jgi:hypothetical protein
MQVAFTICSNNYLAQAKVLGMSLKEHQPDDPFYIFLCDEKIPEIDYSSLADAVIPIADIEPAIQQLALKYNIIELNTCIKPRVFEYLLHEKHMHKVLYLDPDIQVFSPLTTLYEMLDRADILLTPHIYTPIPIDGKTPAEHTFLNYGIYNLGFAGVSNREAAHRFTSWWKEHTYQEGFIAVEKGIFVDQLPVNHAPLFFNTAHILQHRGANMAPWNLHERYLSLQQGKYVVNENEALLFYHFSSFRVDSNELPLHYYNRFTLAARPDLQPLYAAYNEALKAAGHAFYQQFESRYSLLRKARTEDMKNARKPGRKLWKKLFHG